MNPLWSWKLQYLKYHLHTQEGDGKLLSFSISITHSLYQGAKIDTLEGKDKQASKRSSGLSFYRMLLWKYERDICTHMIQASSILVRHHKFMQIRNLCPFFQVEVTLQWGTQLGMYFGSEFLPQLGKSVQLSTCATIQCGSKLSYFFTSKHIHINTDEKES